MPLRKAVGDLEGIDFVLSEVHDDGVGDAIASALYTKGFCAVDAAVPRDIVSRAVADAGNLRSIGTFHMVPEEVANGLLGIEGSAEIVEMPPEFKAGSGIEAVVDAMHDLGDGLGDYLDMELTHRAATVLHEAGVPKEPPPLSEKDITQWLDKFIRHKVMVITFLGPAEGILRLEVYSDEESDRHEIRTRPGMVVFLRPDLMSHHHSAMGKALAVSTFYIDGHTYSKRHPTGGWIVCPPAAELDRWAMARIKELKSQAADDADWDPELPREWQRAMNLYYFHGAMTAVSSIAGRYPATWGGDTWFRSVSAGADVVVNVPRARWDHEFTYDASPEGYRFGKTFTNHGAFMEGVDLFDNKLFGISVNESRGMDPSQRHVLEVGYEVLVRSGYVKKQLMNAPASVYTGTQCFEFSQVEVPKECQGCGPTGNAGCILANRLSYVLGMKGPSMTIDTDTASSMSALYLASESLQHKGRGKVADFGVGIGCSIMFSPIWWHQHNALGLMGHKGRCFTLDAGADGYVRAEAVVAAALRPYLNIVDGEQVKNDDKQHLGIIAGIAVNNNGCGARMGQPNGRAEQEVIADTVRNAGVAPPDIDFCEMHAYGSLLGDAIEVASLTRGHRPYAGDQPKGDPGFPLAITSAKSTCANTMESGGIVGLTKVLYGAVFGLVAPSLHLREVNAYMDVDDAQAIFPSDCVDLWRSFNFSGVLSKGWGGTNAYAITWGSMDQDKVSASGAEVVHKHIHFWPGGGGNLDPELLPELGYWIVGSWTEWENPERMEEESVDVFGYTVTLGVNGWEHFQIWLDGTSSKVLHPGEAAAPMDAPVLGPDQDEDCLGNTWLIYGRNIPPAPIADAPAGGADGSGDVVEGTAAMAAPSSSSVSPTGKPGDRYRVQLTIAGKWRRVDWERLEQVGERPEAPCGKYYVAGDFCEGDFKEMLRDPDDACVWHSEVVLRHNGGRFHIFRNRDYAQTFHPSRPECPDCEDLVGPDDGGYGLDWCIAGYFGETFRITFERRVGAVADERKVSWSRVGKER